MALFQLVAAYINLAGNSGNVVYRGASEAVTYPEAVVLAAIHGGTEHVHTMVDQGTVERTQDEEYARLLSTYGSIVEKVFPKMGLTVMLPLADDALPTQAEVDAGNAASAVASAAVRATRTAPSKKKAAAAAPAPTPEQPSLPFTAEAPAADPVADALVPNLADLPS